MGSTAKKVSRFQHSGGWHLCTGNNEGKWVNQPGRELSMMVYTGRLHPGGVYFSGFRNLKA